MSNRYEIIAPLAQGGQGEILLARRVGPAGFAKLVVLKKPKEALRSPALVAALIEEARLLAQINHSNVCQVHDLEEAGGEFFLALEYLEGLTAWDVLASAEDSHAPIEPGALCGILAQACDGLAAIHKLRGAVVHRDISPSNLFVTESGTIKILDLGIAKSADSEEKTPFGRVKGKLTYLSPEQVQGKPIDGRADLFALGLVFYDLAKGARPPRDRIGALAAIDVGDLAAPLGAVVKRATAPDPGDRFATAVEMGAALRAAGATLGSFFERGELAEWVARRFGNELAHRKDRLHAEEKQTAVHTGTVSRVLTMRSALHDNSPTSLLSREASQVMFTGGTERLPLPEHERLTSSAYFAAEQLPKPRAKPRIAMIAAAAVISVAVAMVVLVSSRTREPVASAEHDASPVVSLPTVSSPAVVSPPMPAVVARDETSKPVRHAKPVRADKPKSAVLGKKPEPRGMMTVDSNPYAVIKIDRISIGTTPLFRVSLPAGKHELRATDPSGREQTRTITIEDGKEERLRLDWSSP